MTGHYTADMAAIAALPMAADVPALLAERADLARRLRAVRALTDTSSACVPVATLNAVLGQPHPAEGTP